MKKPYDYRGFSLKKLNEPRFAHVKLLGGLDRLFLPVFHHGEPDPP